LIPTRPRAQTKGTHLDWHLREVFVTITASGEGLRRFAFDERLDEIYGEQQLAVETIARSGSLISYS
jgi:hypothetical protein